MKQEIIISVSFALAFVFGVKAWLHNLLRFKMDESEILNFFKESGGNCPFRHTDEISEGTDIDVTRVSQVCIKSKSIKRNPKEKESWCLEQL